MNLKMSCINVDAQVTSNDCPEMQSHSLITEIALRFLALEKSLGPSTLLLMSHPKRGFWARRWGTYHFWEIHICGAAPLSINAILPISEGLVAARMTLCAVVNTSHPHIPETHQESRMNAFVG